MQPDIHADESHEWELLEAEDVETSPLTPTDASAHAVEAAQTHWPAEPADVCKEASACGPIQAPAAEPSNRIEDPAPVVNDPFPAPSNVASQLADALEVSTTDNVLNRLDAARRRVPGRVLFTADCIVHGQPAWVVGSKVVWYALRLLHVEGATSQTVRSTKVREFLSREELDLAAARLASEHNGAENKAPPARQAFSLDLASQHVTESELTEGVRNAGIPTGRSLQPLCLP